MLNIEFAEILYRLLDYVVDVAFKISIILVLLISNLNLSFVRTLIIWEDLYLPHSPPAA